MSEIPKLRSEYDTEGIEPEDLASDPLVEIERWLHLAIDSGVPQANAMSLGTATAHGVPSVRTVLLREIDSGLIFYTNYRSRKGLDLAAMPIAAAALTWVPLHRQIRASGPVATIEESKSDAYFASRPPGAQIAAAVSNQSEVIENRAVLETRFAAMEAANPEGIDRPPQWGGYRLIPHRVEFWMGRRNRLHDRVEYLRDGATWKRHRLSP